MNIVHPRIVASQDAILNSAVSQGSGLVAQISAFADPAPLSTQEAQHIALLQTSVPITIAPAQQDASAEEPTGGRLNIQA